jgi:ClpP class serine protease
MFHPRIAAKIESTRWAILPDSLRAITRAIDRGLDEGDREFFHKLAEEDLEAFVADLGPRIPDTDHAFRSGSTGVLFVDGPVIPQASSLTRASGLVSIQALTADFLKLQKDARIKRIMLAFDSPGGDVTGISDFSTLIKASSKPTVGYVFGMCASAAYWIASACDTIYSVDTGVIGGLGIVGTYRVRSAPEGETVWEIVSSQTPNKRFDMADDEARARLQKNADDLADVFLGAVASNMGVSLEKVTNDFGQGATMVALPALEAGMIHEIAPFAEVLRAQAPPRSGASVTQTLIFSKAEFPKREDAVKWARDHDFRTDKVDETEHNWRLRQRDPGDFARFRTITMTTGVQAVIGPLKPGARPAPRATAGGGALPPTTPEAREVINRYISRLHGRTPKIDREKTGSTIPAIAGKKGVSHMDPTLKELMASEPAIARAVEALKKEAFAAGRESGEQTAKARIEAASPFLKADSDYPDSVRQVALGVLSGKYETATLQATVAAVDAVTEGEKSKKAKADSDDAGDTPPIDPKIGGQNPEKWAGYLTDEENEAEIVRIRKGKGLEV